MENNRNNLNGSLKLFDLWAIKIKQYVHVNLITSCIHPVCLPAQKQLESGLANLT